LASQQLGFDPKQDFLIRHAFCRGGLDNQEKESMDAECVVAVYESLKKAEQAVHILRRADFPTDQISLVAAKSEITPELVEQLKMGDDSIRDAAIGAGLGGVMGVVAGIGAMVVSGLGVVFLAGPIGGGLFGAMVGAFLGSLGGWGVHQERIRHYEQCISDGSVLVIAHGKPLQMDNAERILRETDAAEVNLHARTSADSSEILED
jgi:uncharacterized membrane protein